MFLDFYPLSKYQGTLFLIFMYEFIRACLNFKVVYFIFHTSGFNFPLFLRVLGNQAKLAFSVHLTGNGVNLPSALFPLTELSESKEREAEASSC